MTTSLPPTDSEAKAAVLAGAPFDATEPADPGKGGYVYHDPRIVYAVNIALVTRRPLLVTGTPGSGKSTLADDVARRLDWALVRTTITSRTRIEDLVARFDTVRRLSDATATGQVDTSRSAYLVPGVLWWAFDAETAAQLRDAEDTRWNPSGAARGTVVLLDEIDKAEPDLPNDLLAPLDRYVIDVPVVGPIAAERGCLVIITSNGERTMPPAFLRRCVTLELDDSDPTFFVAVATSHFGTRDDSLYRKVADRTLTLIDEAERAQRREPSMAEYLDTLRACIQFGEHPDSRLWNQIEEVALRKTRIKPPPVAP